MAEAAAAAVKMTCKEDGSACACSSFDAPVQSRSVKVDLSDGQPKYICACTKSKNFPFCDGSHVALNKETGSNFRPAVATQEEFGDRVGICACGHSKHRDQQNEDGSYKVPKCDGTHRNLVALKD